METELLLAATSTGEAITFWVLGPLSAVAALMMVLSRNTVHAALFLAAVMLSLAGLYAAQDAPFLAAAQVIVYTGAVLMLFLFVLMLVGVDSSDSLVETLRGQRVAALLVGVAKLRDGDTLVGIAALLYGVACLHLFGVRFLRSEYESRRPKPTLLGLWLMGNTPLDKLHQDSVFHPPADGRRP